MMLPISRDVGDNFGREILKAQMNCFMESREAAAEETLVDVRAFHGHPNRAERGITLLPADYPLNRSWPSNDTMSAQAAYVETLELFEGAAATAEKSRNTDELQTALLGVVEAAGKIADGGWLVNWQQNIQWMLRYSGFGLSGCSVVERYDPGCLQVRLSERLEVLGSMVFYRQTREGRELSNLTSIVMTQASYAEYGSVLLSLNRGIGRRYSSSWQERGTGPSWRLLVD